MPSHRPYTRRGAERGAAGKPAAYVISTLQHDPLTSVKLINKLLLQGIEIQRASKPFTTADGTATLTDALAVGRYDGKSVTETGNRPRRAAVAASVTYPAWTDSANVCDPAWVSVTDPMLVVRRHVDLLRVRSAICRPAR